MFEKSMVGFASLASHEIRTPLTVIEGYLYLMLINKDFKYNSLTKEYLTMLHSTTLDLIKLSNDILSISKLDESSIEVDIEPVDLGLLIEKSVNEHIKIARLKDLDITYNFKKVPSIMTDRSKLNEIVSNLIENAIKFSIKGTISIELDQDDNNITISVEDTGIGIPKESTDKIFKKFYQVENPLIRKSGGTGLGLYISKTLAKRLGGNLILEQTSKKGSKFTLRLPIKYPYGSDLKKKENRELKEFIKGF